MEDIRTRSPTSSNSSRRIETNICLMTTTYLGWGCGIEQNQSRLYGHCWRTFQALFCVLATVHSIYFLVERPQLSVGYWIPGVHLVLQISWYWFTDACTYTISLSCSWPWLLARSIIKWWIRMNGHVVNEMNFVPWWVLYTSNGMLGMVFPTLLEYVEGQTIFCLFVLRMTQQHFPGSGNM